MIKPKLIRRRVFNNLQEFFCFILCNFSRFTRLRAITIEDLWERSIQSINLFSPYGTSYIIGIATTQSTNLLKKCKCLFLKDKSAICGFKQFIYYWRWILVHMKRNKVITIACSRWSNTSVNN